MLVHLLIFLLTPPLVIGYPEINEEVLGLLTFKADLRDPCGKLQSWNEEDSDPCNWTGLACNPRNNRVTDLALDGFCLSGRIGRGLLSLQFLRKLSLSNNSFTSVISPSLANLRSLQVMDVSHNKLTGSIPDELFQHCRLLREVSFARNSLSGSIPPSLRTCSGLLRLNLSSNKLSGSLPPGIWSLMKLRSIDLSDNLLDGEIPRGIGGLYGLRAVNLSGNGFSGQAPEDMGGCSRLESVDLSRNSFSGDLPESMRRLSRACTSLKLRRNAFSGAVPDWIGELRSLLILDLSENRFSGQIPNSIGNLPALKELNLSMNNLTGNLPETLANCSFLSVLDVSKNSLVAELMLPSSYRSLQILDLSANALSGQIPSMIGNFSSLVFLNASNNFLRGSIPASIGLLRAARLLDLSDNRLNGSIPSEIGGATSLEHLWLRNNSLTGRIPVQLQKCVALSSLVLSHNNLTGAIPAAIGNLANLQNVDFSLNSLSGSLPRALSNLSHLLVFNISHNRIEGALPSSGFFNTISPSSVLGNPSLCGAMGHHPCAGTHQKPIVLNPNSSDSPKSSFPPHPKRTLLSISALIAIGAFVCIALGVAAVTLLNIHARAAMVHSPAAVTLSGRDDFSCSPGTDPNYGKLFMFSGDADFVAGAHALLNKDCELGRGGFGTVYQATLKDGRSVAIKKLTVSSLIKSQEDFEKEVKKLGKIQHPNLVALEGYYWTPTLQLLIHEYLREGSLHKHLHEGDGKLLSWRERFEIVFGVARGLAHLHGVGIIHYNLKSTNVLMGGSGEAKVGDFGLARLLPMLDHYVLSSKMQGALGYMAPEFACRTVRITEKCDVFGFGVLVLEVVTGRKAVEYMEDDVVVLCELVRGALEGGRVEGCVDARLGGEFAADEAVPLMKLGLICASQVPSNRPDMGEVINILELIQCPSEGADGLELE